MESYSPQKVVPALMAATKSSIGVLSPRLFCKTQIPSSVANAIGDGFYFTRRREHSGKLRPWKSLSRFLNWLASPSAAIFVNSSLCMGLSLTAIRTHSPDGKKSTVSVPS